MSSRHSAARLAAEPGAAQRALKPGGRLLLDADWRRRPLGGGQATGSGAQRAETGTGA